MSGGDESSSLGLRACGRLFPEHGNDGLQVLAPLAELRSGGSSNSLTTSRMAAHSVAERRAMR
jgi:hypothetical protein